MTPCPAGIILGWASTRTSPRAPQGPSKSCFSFQVPRRPHPHPPHPHQGYTTPVSAPLGPLALALWALFWGGPSHTPPPGHREAPRKALPLSESRGGHTPHPHQGYSTPFSRAPRDFGPPTCGHYFKAGHCPHHPAGALRVLANPYPNPSPTEATPSSSLPRLSQTHLDALGAFCPPTCGQ